MNPDKNKTKTIFFSIASKFIMRNFFFVEGGVFDILKKDKNLKIILLMSDALYKKNEDFFKKNSSPNVVIETIETTYHMVGENLLQKLFIFFYSYLVFTPTTRLLASKGARADISVSKYAHYLYFLKWLNYQIFGHLFFIKKWLVPKIYPFIFRKRQYKYLFDKYKPDLLFVPNVAHNPDMKLLDEARRQKIKTIGMCGSWDHFNKYFVPVRSDVLLAWNDPLKEEAIKYEGYDPKQIEMVGFPQFDSYMKNNFLISKEEFYKKIGFEKDKKIIFFASEGAYSLDGKDIVDMITRWIEKEKLSKDSRIILRLYPGVNSEEETYKDFFDNKYVFVDRVDNWSSRENFYNFINTMYYSDIVISTYSTISVEGCVFDKPLININFDGYSKRPGNKTVKRLKKLSHFTHVFNTGALSDVSSGEELLNTLNKYLENPEFKSDQRKKMVERMCFRLDGKSSERIANKIIQNLDK